MLTAISKKCVFLHTQINKSRNDNILNSDSCNLAYLEKKRERQALERKNNPATAQLLFIDGFACGWIYFPA